MVRWCLLALLAVGSVGCGPLSQPMVQRLDEPTQRQFDDMWDNILYQPQRVDRQTLLDVMVVYQFFQVGIDRLVMTSEKDVLGGRVVMTVRFDRAQPLHDEFVLAYVDRHGQERRRERYTRDEVQESLNTLGALEGWKAVDAHFVATSGPATEPAETDEERAVREALAARRARMQAATRPVR